jgi:hypothetical protein
MHVVIGKMTKKTFIFQASIAMEMAEAIMFVNSSDVMLAANTNCLFYLFSLSSQTV